MLKDLYMQCSRSPNQGLKKIYIPTHCIKQTSKTFCLGTWPKQKPTPLTTRHFCLTHSLTRSSECSIKFHSCVSRYNFTKSMGVILALNLVIWCWKNKVHPVSCSSVRVMSKFCLKLKSVGLCKGNWGQNLIIYSGISFACPMRLTAYERLRARRNKTVPEYNLLPNRGISEQ